MQTIIKAALIVLICIGLPFILFLAMLLWKALKLAWRVFTKYHGIAAIAVFGIDILLSMYIPGYHSDLKTVTIIAVVAMLAWSGYDSVREIQGKEPISIKHRIKEMLSRIQKPEKEAKPEQEPEEEEPVVYRVLADGSVVVAESEYKEC